jgi:hypothetical protein
VALRSVLAVGRPLQFDFRTNWLVVGFLLARFAARSGDCHAVIVLGSFRLSAPVAEEGEPMRELLHEPAVTYHE